MVLLSGLTTAWWSLKNEETFSAWVQNAPLIPCDPNLCILVELQRIALSKLDFYQAFSPFCGIVPDTYFKDPKNLIANLFFKREPHYVTSIRLSTEYLLFPPLLFPKISLSAHEGTDHHKAKLMCEKIKFLRPVKGLISHPN